MLILRMLGWTWPLRLLFHPKRWFVVAIEHPEGLVGERFHVKTWDEEDAFRQAAYYMFKRRDTIPDWFHWKFEVVDDATDGTVYPRAGTTYRSA